MSSVSLDQSVSDIIIITPSSSCRVLALRECVDQQRQPGDVRRDRSDCRDELSWRRRASRAALPVRQHRGVGRQRLLPPDVVWARLWAAGQQRVESLLWATGASISADKSLTESSSHFCVCRRLQALPFVQCYIMVWALGSMLLAVTVVAGTIRQPNMKAD